MSCQQNLQQDSLYQDTSILPPIPFIKVDPVIIPDTIQETSSLKDSLKSLVPKKDVKIIWTQTRPFNFITDTVKDPYELNFIFKASPPDLGYQSSLFTAHELQVKDFKIEKIEQKNNDWILALILAALFIIAWVKVFQHKKLKQYLNAFGNENLAGKISREEKVFSEQASVLLFISSLIALSLFIFQIINFYGFRLINFNQPVHLFFFKILLIVLGAIILKLMVLKTAGFIFKTNKLASDYAFTIVLFINILSFLLLPIVIAIEYMPMISDENFILIGVIITLLIFLYRNYRGFVLGNSERSVSKFYLFLYLCTLEILPLIVLFKAFTGKV